MEVRKGYKQTEVGVIPEDWDVKKLGELVSLRTGPFGSSVHKSDYVNSGIPFINPTHIFNGELFPDPNVTVSPETVARLSEFQLRINDIIMGRRGEMGRCAVVKEGQQGWLCGSGSMILRPNSKIVPEFLQRVISSPLVIKKIEETSVGSTMINLNQAVVNGLPITYPPLAEQEAIAEALSDADALIESLETLLAKKRQVKHGAMSELLRPKAGWVEITVADLAGGANNIVDGPFGSNLKNSDYVANGVPVLQGLNITHDKFIWKEVRYISHKKAKDLYRSNAQVGDLLTVKIGSVGFSAIIDNLDGNEFAIIPANLLRTRIQNRNTNINFIFYLLTSDFGKKKLRDLAGNTAQPAIGLTGYRNLSFVVPSSYEEQTAIAEILSDMDAEIRAVEEKLSKARAVKAGMMSELLTGRIRLNRD